MKHVGILAHSPDGSALCYLSLIRSGHELFGTYGHGEITLDYIPMGRSMQNWDAGRHATIRETLLLSIQRLHAAGTDFFICPDNTAHIALEQPGPAFPLPGLNIADVVAEKASDLNYRRVAILGTRYTMTGPVYPRAFAARGVEAVVPSEGDQELLNRIIFDELCAGTVWDGARRDFDAIVARMKNSGCDAAALVCTELPLLIAEGEPALPYLDSTRLLADAAFDVTIGEREPPRWRGGPPVHKS